MLLLRIAALALIASFPTLLVLHARGFSHDGRWLALLDDVAWQGWLVTTLYVGLLWQRRRLAREGTDRLLHGLPLGLGLAVLLVGAAAPFTNAYFTHVTHPIVAAWLAWLVWPFVERAGSHLTGPAWIGARGAGLAGLFVFLVVFLQSYRRHYWFGSGGKDLGLFHQTVWLLSRFEAPRNTVMGMNAFADHVELIDVLAAPLQWVWPSAAALLLFQAALIGAGVVPLFILAKDHTQSAAAGWAVVVAYLFNIDLQNAVMFDWNPTTCGVAFIPWVVLFFRRGHLAAAGVALALLALAKENLTLYGVGVCVALALGASERRARRWALGAAGVCLVWFVIEMKVIFPLMRDGGFRHLQYEEMGGSFGELLGSALNSPYRAFSLLFTPGRKIDGLLAGLSSVAFVALLAPRWLIALAPVALERFWSTHQNRWWGYHYGAGAAVVAVVAAVEALPRLRALAPRLPGPALLALALSAVLVGTLGRFGTGPLFVWWHGYYTPRAERQATIDALATIPPDAAVAAQNHLIPYLSARRQLFELHEPIGAEWVALHLGQSAWPYGDEHPRLLAKRLLAADYGVVACSGRALVLRRGVADKRCDSL